MYYTVRLAQMLVAGLSFFVPGSIPTVNKWNGYVRQVEQGVFPRVSDRYPGFLHQHRPRISTEDGACRGCVRLCLTCVLCGSLCQYNVHARTSEYTLESKHSTTYCIVIIKKTTQATICTAVIAVLERISNLVISSKLNFTMYFDVRKCCLFKTKYSEYF